MIDSRAKGSRTELLVRDILRKMTNLQWERVPMSGGLSASHKLKGDLYIVDSLNIFCVEVKGYADDHYTSKIFTDKKPQLIEWWEQTIREAAQIGRKPLLIFKFDRSKFFVAFKDMPTTDEYRWTYNNLNGHEFYVSQLEKWIEHENPRFT